MMGAGDVLSQSTPINVQCACLESISCHLQNCYEFAVHVEPLRIGRGEPAGDETRRVQFRLVASPGLPNHMVPLSFPLL
jgi:hypothetical protein